MTHRERILAVFRGDTPDRVPWFADLNWWIDAMVEQGEAPADLQTLETRCQFYRDLGAGFYFRMNQFPYRAVPDDTVRVTRERLGQTWRRTVETPIGCLVQERTRLTGSFSAGFSRRQIQSPADLRILRYVVEHTHYEADYEGARQCYPLIQDIGIVYYCLPKTPAMDLICNLAGIETFTELWLEAREELEETLRVMERKYDEAAAIAVASPVEFIWSPETLSSELVGERFFDSYVRGFQEKWVDRVRRSGKRAVIHMDGSLRGLIRQVAAVGYDAIEAVAPAPVGDLTLSEMRERVGPNTILWGGLPSAYFTALIDDDEFNRMVLDVLSVMTSAPRYILGVADQVPPAALRDRVVRVAELVERHGTYG